MRDAHGHQKMNSLLSSVRGGTKSHAKFNTHPKYAWHTKNLYDLNEERIGKTRGRSKKNRKNTNYNNDRATGNRGRSRRPLSKAPPGRDGGERGTHLPVVTATLVHAQETLLSFQHPLSDVHITCHAQQNTTQHAVCTHMPSSGQSKPIDL